MHARKSRSEWGAIVEAYERTGGPHEAFCSARGLKIASFRGWLYRIRRAAATSHAIALLPVEVTPAVASTVSTIRKVEGCGADPDQLP
jgi:hypothetical protein